MNLKNSLPIGSVVMVKGIKRKVMIFGYKQKRRGQNENVFDYIGVVYPEGHIDNRLHIGFNQENIEKVIFRGYEDEHVAREKPPAHAQTAIQNEQRDQLADIFEYLDDMMKQVGDR